LQFVPTRSGKTPLEFGGILPFLPLYLFPLIPLLYHLFLFPDNLTCPSDVQTEDELPAEVKGPNDLIDKLRHLEPTSQPFRSLLYP
jgi:hypothetical protein